MKTAVLVVMFAVAPIAPARADQATDLSGTWKDSRGPNVEIAQTGNNVTLTAPNGILLKGDLNGASLAVQGVFGGNQVSGAPAAVQTAIGARNLMIKFAAAVDAAGEKITGVETKPDDIEWNGDNQITVLKIGTGKPVILSRKTVVVSGSAPLAKPGTMP